MFSTLVKLARLNFLLGVSFTLTSERDEDPTSLSVRVLADDNDDDSNVPEGLLKLLTLTFPPTPSPSPPLLTRPGLGWGMWAVGTGAGGVAGGIGGTKLTLSHLCLGGVLSGGGGGCVL